VTRTSAHPATAHLRLDEVDMSMAAIVVEPTTAGSNAPVSPPKKLIESKAA